MSTCQVSAAQLLCASSAKHQTLTLGKPVLRARLFRHFPGEGSALRLDRTFPRTVPSLLHQPLDLQRTLVFADRHHQLVLTAQQSYNTGQARRCSAAGKQARSGPERQNSLPKCLLLASQVIPRAQAIWLPQPIS